MVAIIFRRKILKVLRWGWKAIECLFVILVLLFALLNFRSSISSSGLFEYKGYTVISGSMEPKINVGDFVIVRNKGYDSVKTDQIISFASDDIVVTHRVVEQSSTGSVTRGDANEVNDVNEVTAANYIGTLQWIIPYLGYAIVWLQKPWVYGLVMALIALRLLVAIIYKK